MKIHLVVLIAPDIDHDLIDHWISHYKDLDIDTYTAFIHKQQNKKHLEVVEKLLDAGFKVLYADSAYPNGEGLRQDFVEETRHNVFTGFSAMVPDNEYILTVDSDEIQVWNEPIKEVMLNGVIDVMWGEIVDAFGDELKDVVPDIPLNIQYPHESLRLEEKIDGKINARLDQKIVCAKAKVPVCFRGSHEISTLKNVDGYNRFTARGKIKILHYKWRNSMKERFEAKPYYKNEDIDTLIKAFAND